MEKSNCPPVRSAAETMTTTSGGVEAECHTMITFPPEMALRDRIFKVIRDCVGKKNCRCEGRVDAMLTTALSAEYRKGLRRGAELVEEFGCTFGCGLAAKNDLGHGRACPVTIATALRQEAGEDG